MPALMGQDLSAASAGAGPVPPPPDAKSVMLFNVVTDPNETNDVAAANPAIVKQLLDELDAAPQAPRTLSEWPMRTMPTPN
jgi:hypothetical protein